MPHGDPLGYWGNVEDVDQRMVELAAIAFALRLASSEIWASLSATAKANVISYLLAARLRAFSDNNWKFFRLMIDLGLRRLASGRTCPGTTTIWTS